MNLSESIIVSCFIVMAYYFGKFIERKIQQVYIDQLRKFIEILQEQQYTNQIKKEKEKYKKKVINNE